MLDMGFLPDIQRILELLPRQRQNLMFSATFSDDIRRLSGSILRDPATVEVAPAEHRRRDRSTSSSTRSTATARRRCWPTSSASATCARCSSSPGPSWPPRAWRPALDREGLDAVAIHSDRSQPERTRALEGFKAGDIRVLVATDVAARGLDIEDLPVVVNFELPWNPQDYIHRIGRTGRAGADGEAISLVCIDEVDLLRGIQRMLNRPSRGRSRTASCRTGTRRRGRSGCAAGMPDVAATHHAHRKPVRRRSGAGQSLTGGRVAQASGRLAVSSSAAPGKKNPSIRSAATRSTA